MVKKEEEKAIRDAEIVAELAPDPKTRKEAEKVLDIAEEVKPSKSKNALYEGPSPTVESERNRQCVQIIGIRRSGGKIAQVKFLSGDIQDVGAVRELIKDKVPVVVVDESGNATMIGPRDESMISSLPDDSIANNLGHLHEF